MSGDGGGQDTSLDFEESFYGFNESYFTPSSAIGMLAVPDEPKSVKAALSGTYASKWKQAMKDEYDSLRDNDIWTLVNLSSGRKAINSMWVYTLKCNTQ